METWTKAQGRSPKEYYRHIYAEGLTYTVVVGSVVPKRFYRKLFSPSQLVKHEPLRRPRSFLDAMLEAEALAVEEGFSLTSPEGMAV